jgi:hypothetical protein
MELDDVRPDGFTVSGSGTVPIVTAPSYKAGHPYDIELNSARHVLRADTDGRLHLTIRLGSQASTAHVRVSSMP